MLRGRERGWLVFEEEKRRGDEGREGGRGGGLLRGLIKARRGVCGVGIPLGRWSLRLRFWRPFLRCCVGFGI